MFDFLEAAEREPTCENYLTLAATELLQGRISHKDQQLRRALQHYHKSSELLSTQPGDVLSSFFKSLIYEGLANTNYLIAQLPSTPK